MKVLLISISLLIIFIGCVEKPAEQIIHVTDVYIKDLTFTPNTIGIRTGNTVTLTNLDNVPHKIKAGNISTDILQNETFNFTFNESGTYEYSCELHPLMKHGFIIVES